MHNIYITILFIYALIPIKSFAQIDTATSDGLFKAARQSAFEEKNYSKASYYCNKALSISPTYTDIRIFAGRLYGWRDMYDSARFSFQQAIKDNPHSEDAYVAFTNLEYWEDRNKDALEICQVGLQVFPQSATLLLQKAKILNSLHQYKESLTTLNLLLKIDKKNAAARSLVENISNSAARNKLGISYDYDRFDKQFTDSWHLINIFYSRQTTFGSIIGNINYANRFKQNGIQFEIEAYPRISKMFYSYVSGGYSPDDGIFPKYRAGFSLYANLPQSFEAELGFRYLYFGSSTWVYTAAVGKYYKNWLFGTRIYLTPGSFGVSQSYNISARYYLGGADDFIGLLAGTGVSPDDRKNNILLSQNLSVHKVYGTYRWSVKKQHIFSIIGGWENREYIPQTRGNQFNLSFAYIKRF